MGTQQNHIESLEKDELGQTETQELSNKLTEIIALLKSISTLNKPVMDIDEAAEYTNSTTSWLYKKTSKGEIPHYKPNGKKLYFKRIELDDWMQRNRIKPNYEIEQEASNRVAGV